MYYVEAEALERAPPTPPSRDVSMPVKSPSTPRHETKYADVGCNLVIVLLSYDCDFVVDPCPVIVRQGLRTQNK